MKQWIGLACLVLSLAACKKENTQPGVITVEADGCTTEKEATICLEHVEDSRCPQGTNCPWEGLASADMQIRVNNVSRSFTLHTHEGLIDNTRKDTVLLGYKIELIDVLPYPTLTNTGASKKAVVKLTKL